MSKPLCVAISDIHFTVQNLELCSKALMAAIEKSNKLKVPLVIAGDLNDTKAIIRAEVANRLISLLEHAKMDVYILVGNHDLINEKGKEHGLNYLGPYANLVSSPVQAPFSDTAYLVPYFSDSDSLLSFTANIPDGSILIMHQGFLGASMGDYVQDKSSLDPSLLTHHTVISGHYHKHQTIGPVTYIGSPFTMTFGEANDGPKGYLVINTDGSFTREILELRRHTILTFTTDSIAEAYNYTSKPDDLVWMKISGPKSELIKIDKVKLGDVRLELVPNDTGELPEQLSDCTTSELLDAIIDNLSDTDYYKIELKSLWRELLNETS